MNMMFNTPTSITVLLLVLYHLATCAEAFQYPALLTSRGLSHASQTPRKRDYQDQLSRQKEGYRLLRRSPTTNTNVPLHNSIKSIGEGIDMMVTVYNSADFICDRETNLEVEVFADLAHFSLDLATFLSPDTTVLRFCVVLGRLCSILADYLPDHSMTIDETIFQSFMLVVSMRLFSESLLSLITSTPKTMSIKDKKIYQRIFSPAGFSWIQFKSLTSDVMNWIEIPAETTFQDDEDALYLVYRGSMECYINGSIAHSYHKCTSLSSGSIIGDLNYAKQLTTECCKAQRRRSSSVTTMHQGSPSHTHSLAHLDHCSKSFLLEQITPTDSVSFRSGTDGVILLRIDTPKLSSIAKRDDKMNECVRNLVFGSIQDKLNRFVQEGHESRRL